MPRNVDNPPHRDIRLSAGEKHRAELLDTAKKIFLEKGFNSATVNDILMAVGLSKGGFYHHFKSKDEVLDALRVQYTKRFLEIVEKRVAAVPDDAMEERFQTWIKAFVDAYYSSYAEHDLFYHSVHSNRANADRTAIIKSLMRLLEQGLAKGAWSLSSPLLTATIMYSAIHGVVDEAIAAQNKEHILLAEHLYTSLKLLLQR
ncbi:TetR/AcrR family transcriptional regulator [Solidesulfovibrio sp. C21]|uniref:TetR/AcrR family transcriptional regulator n=1 Tax=Solidesulfovibrio sp. C21 TaxID=3398613 RepID=UPI0039FB8CDD